MRDGGPDAMGPHAADEIGKRERGQDKEVAQPCKNARLLRKSSRTLCRQQAWSPQ